MVKNVLEILFAIIFVFFNTTWLWAYDFSENDKPGMCDIKLLRNNVRKNYFVNMMCKFFDNILVILIILQSTGDCCNAV